MNSENFFTKKLNIQFTMNELYDIASALATESFNESEIGNKNNAERMWKIRYKVLNIIDANK